MDDTSRCWWIVDLLPTIRPSEFTPWQRDFKSDVEVLEVPHTIVAASQHLLIGVATGIVNGAVTDDGGTEPPVSFCAEWCQK